jgi:hypothetical protein
MFRKMSLTYPNKRIHDKARQPEKRVPFAHGHFIQEFPKSNGTEDSKEDSPKHLTQVCSQGTASIRRKLSEECEGTVIAGLGISQGPACEVREGIG